MAIYALRLYPSCSIALVLFIYNSELSVLNFQMHSIPYLHISIEFLSARYEQGADKLWSSIKRTERIQTQLICMLTASFGASEIPRLRSLDENLKDSMRFLIRFIAPILIERVSALLEVSSVNCRGMITRQAAHVT